MSINTDAPVLTVLEVSWLTDFNRDSGSKKEREGSASERAESVRENRPDDARAGCQLTVGESCSFRRAIIPARFPLRTAFTTAPHGT